jgi:hypothetical protein
MQESKKRKRSDPPPFALKKEKEEKKKAKDKVKLSDEVAEGGDDNGDGVDADCGAKRARIEPEPKPESESEPEPEPKVESEEGLCTILTETNAYLAPYLDPASFVRLESVSKALRRCCLALRGTFLSRHAFVMLGLFMDYHSALMVRSFHRRYVSCIVDTLLWVWMDSENCGLVRYDYDEERVLVKGGSHIEPMVDEVPEPIMDLQGRVALESLVQRARVSLRRWVNGEACTLALLLESGDASGRKTESDEGGGSSEEEEEEEQEEEEEEGDAILRALRRGDRARQLLHELECGKGERDEREKEDHPALAELWEHKGYIEEMADDVLIDIVTRSLTGLFVDWSVPAFAGPYLRRPVHFVFYNHSGFYADDGGDPPHVNRCIREDERSERWLRNHQFDRYYVESGEPKVLDLIDALWQCKTSKRDTYYESFSASATSVSGDEVSVSLVFDHGS